jgi:DNA-binding NarL/FixJ family response regulator
MTNGEKRDRPEEISPTAGEEHGSLSRLSPLQLQVLSRLRQNMQHKAIAQELCVSEDELARQIRHILTSIGARDRTALVVIVDRLERSDSWSPEACRRLASHRRCGER